MNTQPEIGYGKADIHMHTNLGDGWASPAQIVQQATRHGLQVSAVTDPGAAGNASIADD